MNLKENWLAASMFFLAGGILQGVRELIRGQLYAAVLSKPTWSYPDPLIDSMVPGYLQKLAVAAFVLSAASGLWPYVKTITTKLRQE
ncbi:hypothetical protein [Symbiobacterium thermophilum]|uniref:Uncharacterized protein n=1 Tax=Symbiobacterium thermophilum TaxID=2734 RepID=A0A953ICK8_SYMTR|nr:hypothetical protein [Symbiobacterium thermophilum]MBY6278518.1 hypothetical protein [Symbiobacterium thermophilum]